MFSYVLPITFLRVGSGCSAFPLVGGIVICSSGCRPIAEHAGERTPDGVQHLLKRARIDTDGIRYDLRYYVAAYLDVSGCRTGQRRDRGSEKRHSDGSLLSVDTPEPLGESRTRRSLSTDLCRAARHPRRGGRSGRPSAIGNIVWPEERINGRLQRLPFSGPAKCSRLFRHDIRVTMRAPIPGAPPGYREHFRTHVTDMARTTRSRAPSGLTHAATTQAR